MDAFITPPVADPAQWFIDVGAFFDRFGASVKQSILASTDNNIQAFVKDAMARKWIDLKRSDLPSSLIALGSLVPAVDATLRSAILNTPVTMMENYALRKAYFQ